jgi:hypothetical protein
MPNYLYSKDLEDTREAIDNVNKFKDCKIDDIELYQSFKALTTYTWNKHAIKIEDPNNLSDRELNYNYD